MRESGNGKTSALTLLRRLMPLAVAVCTLIMGAAFMARTAPGHVPDIWPHVYRISGILNGDVTARHVTSRSMLHNAPGGVGNVGGRVDQQWIDYSLAHYDGYDTGVIIPDSIDRQYTDDSGRVIAVDAPYNNTATNSPVVYAPQLVGFALGRMFGLGADATYRIAEIMMLATYTLCMAVATVVLPRWRILGGLVLLFPLLPRFNSFAISADSFTCALALLFSYMLFRAVVTRVSTRYCAALAVVAVMLSMCKIVYVPLVLLALLVPWVYGGGRARLAILAAGDVLAFAWLAFWLHLTGWFTTTPMIVSYEAMSARKQALLTDPATMIGALRAMSYAVITGQSNLDRASDTLRIRLFWVGVAVLFMLLVVTSLRRALALRGSVRGNAASARHRRVGDSIGSSGSGGPVGMMSPSCRELAFWWAAFVVSVGCVLLTYLALWLQYTPTGVVGVMGFQTRYFLPLCGIWALCALRCVDALASPIGIAGDGAAQTGDVA